jgi:hypothetical protein
MVSATQQFLFSSSDIVATSTVYCCMPLDDGRMTETCCGNIREGEEELLH